MFRADHTQLTDLRSVVSALSPALDAAFAALGRLKTHIDTSATDRTLKRDGFQTRRSPSRIRSAAPVRMPLWKQSSVRFSFGAWFASSALA